MEYLMNFVRDEDGQDLTEYGLLVALIAFIVIVGVTAVGNNLNTFYNTRLAGEIATW